MTQKMAAKLYYSQMQYLAAGVTNVTATINDISHCLMHAFDFEMDDFDLSVLKILSPSSDFIGTNYPYVL